ncbi:MAG: hypothetical protein AAF519_04685 [Bacteroidota bacterium]
MKKPSKEILPVEESLLKFPRDLRMQLKHEPILMQELLEGVRNRGLERSRYRQDFHEGLMSVRPEEHRDSGLRLSGVSALGEAMRKGGLYRPDPEELLSPRRAGTNDSPDRRGQLQEIQNGPESEPGLYQDQSRVLTVSEKAGAPIQVSEGRHPGKKHLKGI